MEMACSIRKNYDVFGLTLYLLCRTTENSRKIYTPSNLMLYILAHLTLFSMPLLQPLAFLPGNKHSQVPNKQQTLLLAHGLW